MARASDAGPSGTGLIPPTGGTGTQNRGSDASEDEANRRNPDDAQDQQDPPDEQAIDGLPPINDRDEDSDDDDEDDDDDDSNGGGSPDLEAAIARIEADMQKRFDKAITKATKKIEARLANANRQSDDEDDDDEEDEDPPKEPRRSTQRQNVPDTRTLMVLARDRVDDSMENRGKAERRAVKEIPDGVIAATDWTRVDDEDEFINGHIENLTKHVDALVKAGSDRKVAQLRNMGVIEESEGQPGDANGRRQGRGSTPSDAMQRGQDRAKNRWPEGRRRMGG